MMSQRVSKMGCRRKTSVSGRPTPLFLLSHGSSVPSGLHTTTETPCQQCVQEGDIFSATSGKGGIMLKTVSKLSGLYWPNDQLCSVWRHSDHFNWTCLGAVSTSHRKNITDWSPGQIINCVPCFSVLFLIWFTTLNNILKYGDFPCVRKGFSRTSPVLEEILNFKSCNQRNKPSHITAGKGLSEQFYRQSLGHTEDMYVCLEPYGRLGFKFAHGQFHLKYPAALK